MKKELRKKKKHRILQKIPVWKNPYKLDFMLVHANLKKSRAQKHKQSTADTFLFDQEVCY